MNKNVKLFLIGLSLLLIFSMGKWYIEYPNQIPDYQLKEDPLFWTGTSNTPLDEVDLKELHWTGCSENAVLFTAELACSGSMKPMLHCGMTIQECDAEGEEIRVGDIVVFNPSYNLSRRVIHRVIHINEKGEYLMKGDATQAPDGYIKRSQIRSKFHGVTYSMNEHEFNAIRNRYSLVVETYDDLVMRYNKLLDVNRDLKAKLNN